MPTLSTLVGYVLLASLLLVVATLCLRVLFSAWAARPRAIDDALQALDDALSSVRTTYDARFRALEVEAEDTKDKVKRAMNRAVARGRRDAEVEEEVTDPTLEALKGKLNGAAAEPEQQGSLFRDNAVRKAELRARASRLGKV